MKKLIICFIVLIFAFISTPSFARSGHGKGNHRGYHRYYYNDTPRYYNYRGYHDRYYGPHKRYYPKNYRGHWQTREDWEYYYRNHYRYYPHGRYYREHGHLFFGFQTPDGFFSFSIGD